MCLEGLILYVWIFLQYIIPPRIWLSSCSSLLENKYFPSPLPSSFYTYVALSLQIPWQICRWSCDIYNIKVLYAPLWTDTALQKTYQFLSSSSLLFWNSWLISFSWLNWMQFTPVDALGKRQISSLSPNACSLHDN